MIYKVDPRIDTVQYSRSVLYRTYRTTNIVLDLKNIVVNNSSRTKKLCLLRKHHKKKFFIVCPEHNIVFNNSSFRTQEIYYSITALNCT
jgi:hypothetical protein